MNPQEHPVLRWPLRALAALYGAAVGLRNRYHDRVATACRPAIPVISVGNITVGGTGKTPTVAWLAERLQRTGELPAVVSRGYGGTAGRGPFVVSRGSGPLCDAAACGDEPFLLASSLDGVRVVVGSDRCAGVAAAAQLGARVAILDDGFQHRRIARDLDIVLLDATHPFGNGRLLPAGPLREPLRSLGRAGLVLVTRGNDDGEVAAIEQTVRRYNPSVPLLRSAHRRRGFRDAGGRAVDPPPRAVAFCGIGNPELFRDDLRAEAVDLVAFEARRDHHRFRPEELCELRDRARSLQATLVTTEKDRVRLGPNPGVADPPLLTLAIEEAPLDPEALIDAVHRAIERTRRP